MKDKILAVIRVLVSFGLLGLLFLLMRYEIHDIWKIITGCNVKLIIAAIGIILVNTMMLAVRLKVVFAGENLNMTMRESMQLTYLGYFFNNFMPTAVGGDIIKAHYAANNNKERARSYASVLMDRLLGLYTFLAVAGIALIVDRGRFHLATVKMTVFIMLLVGTVGIIVIASKTVARVLRQFFTRLKMLSLGERLTKLYDIVHDYRNRPDVIIKSFLISIFAQCLYFFVIYLLFVSLGTRVNLGIIFLIMPVVTIISMLPSIGGLGIRESAIVAFFGVLTGKEIAFATSLLILMGLLIVSSIGGAIYLWWGIKGVKEKVE